MKMPSANMLIIACVAAMGAYVVWQRLHPPPVRYESCYPETAVAKSGKKSDKEYDKALMMMIGNSQRISAIITQSIDKDMPARYVDPVRRFRARSFDELFSPGDAARQDIRELLFVWANVQDVKPESRGPFIDARELAFLERLSREPFLQIGRYPNPAPMAAASLREGFRTILDYVYSEFAAHAAGGQLFDFGSANGNIISVAALEKIRVKAQKLDDAERLRLWQNVIRAIPNDLKKGMTAADHARLNGVIGATLNGMDEKKVAATIPIDNKYIFTDRDNRPVAFNIIFSQDMNNRTICYLHTKQ